MTGRIGPVNHIYPNLIVTLACRIMQGWGFCKKRFYEIQLTG